MLTRPVSRRKALAGGALTLGGLLSGCGGGSGSAAAGTSTSGSTGSGSSPSMPTTPSTPAPPAVDPATLYMVASNRFCFPTDIGTSDIAYNATAAYLGGNGTAKSGGDFHFRRWAFSTTWAPKAGKFLFANVMLLPQGVANLQGQFTISRMEIRRKADLSVVAPVRFGGAASHAFIAGETIFTDAVPDLDANADYFLDIWFTSGRSQGWPCIGGPFTYIAGEVGRDTTTDQSAGAPPTSGISTAFGGGNLGPVGFFAKGWDSSPVALIVGDSREDQTNIAVNLLSRGDIGHVAQALGDAQGGRINYLETARYSCTLATLYNPSTLAGTETKGLFDWLAGIFSSGLGQTRAPFQLIYSEMGVNSVPQGGALQGTVNLFKSAIAKARSYWPNMPWVQETILPYAALPAGATTAFTVEADQTGAFAAFKTTAEGGYIEAVNNAILTDKSFSLGIDVATPLRSSSNYAAWKADGFGTTLVTAAAVGASTVTLAQAPALGSFLVFEPGTANVDAAGYIVNSVTSRANGYDVGLVIPGRGNSYFAKTLVLAHAAGSTVRTAYAYPEGASLQGLHQSHAASLVMRDAIIAGKAQIASLASAYSG